MKKSKIAAVALAASMLAACNSYGPGPGPREGVGTAAGALAGGLLGSTIGSGGGRVAATVGGAVLGGLIGNTIGRSLDEQDQRRAYEAEYRAYAYGEPVAWRSVETGYYGEVVPYDPYRRGGTLCRDYAHTIYVDGRPETARGTACQNRDGTWETVG